MKYFNYFFICLITLLILWIDLPQTIPIKLNAFGSQVDLSIRPLELNFRLGNTQIIRNFDLQLGLDLRGGSHLVYEADISEVQETNLDDALDAARNTIERRVNLFGVAEAEVRTFRSGDNYRISVDLPGIQDTYQASQLIGQTAQLNFKTYPENADDTPEATDTPIFFQLTEETGLTGKDIERATVTFDTQNGQPQVALGFTKEGAEKFAEITRENIGEPVGIFLDEALLSAPVVQQEIIDGNAVISGNFTVEGAKQLAVSINSGALPLPIKLVEQRQVGPSLGAEEVQKSVVAGIVGLGSVMLFMLLYYGRFGAIACLALMIYGLITLAIFKIIPVVLTLPGVAGFLLSIGMAVDSNILIFERVKEEKRKGKKFNIALSKGFVRAIDAIKDANITTLLVAFILFNPLNWDFLPQFGLVRGFALTLAIGVATSLFTGVVITKRLMQFFFKTEI